MALIAAYATPAGPRYGLLVDGIVHVWDGHPLTDHPGAPGRALGPLDELSLLPPLMPGKLVCVGGTTPRTPPSIRPPYPTSRCCSQAAERGHRARRAD